MKIDLLKFFFFLGSAFILFAVFLLTFLLLIADIATGLIVTYQKLKLLTAVLYAAAFIFYFLSSEYFRWQILVIAISCAFFIIFWFIFMGNI